MLEAEDREPLTSWICLISRLSTRYFGREMSRLGFGPGQFFFLSALYREEGLSQDELSRRVGVDKSNTSRALTKLEFYGLIRRESDLENHRVKRVYLETKAREIKNEFMKIQEKWNSIVVAGFSKKYKKRLMSDLKGMANNAKAYFGEQEMFECLTDKTDFHTHVKK
jgi:DNA-binding MarR family transcriptional regulator